MATKKQQKWSTISLQPLTGQLDARYRSNEVPDSGFKEKQNLAVSENGRLTRKCGFERLFAGTTPYVNQDFHKRNASKRKPITGLLEVTKSDGTRSLFASTETEISKLDETTGLWSDIFSAGPGGGKWRGDVLQDTIVFIDRKNAIYSFDLGGSSVAAIPDLQSLGVSSAKVVIQYNGLMILMNTVEGGVPMPSRVRYSDLNNPKSWAVGNPSSVANFQDLDYGEEILAALPLQGNLIIYTNRSIWQAFISIDATNNTAMGFGKIYTEPKNNAGCLVYPDSLVSTGDAHYFASRESFYTYNPYLPTPEAPEWLRQATGLIYTDKTRKVDPTCCLSMCAEYRPLTHEIWISWPSAGNNCLNNQSMILSTKFLTGYYNDAGFSALANYKPNPPAESDCNVSQILVAASTTDYALKQAGLVLFREVVTNSPANATVDLNITAPVWTVTGLTSILRGIIPVTLFDVEKLIRKVVLGAYTAPQTNPCIARLRIGTSAQLTDPNNTTYCQIVWHDIRPDLVLACPEKLTAEQLEAAGLIPSFDQEWNVFERGRFLYFDISILNSDGTPAIGGDLHAFKIDYEILPLPA